MQLYSTPKKASGEPGEGIDADGDALMNGGDSIDEESLLAEAAEDEETRPQFHYRAGYLLEQDSPTYEHIHKLREDVGQLLSKIHEFPE